jgi:Uma2 family endonuclease
MKSAKKLATFDDLAALPERPYREIVHGELVEKAMAGFEHGGAQFSLSAWLGGFARPEQPSAPGGWAFFTELHVEYEVHEVYCHDLCGFRRERLPAKPTGWPARIRPDWVCEIVSPGHEKRDTVDKLWTLHRAGVPHYWIVDRERRLLNVHAWRRDGYLIRPIHGDEVVRAEPFEAVELHVAGLMGD